MTTGLHNAIHLFLLLFFLSPYSCFTDFATFFHGVFAGTVAALASMWQNETWKVILTLSSDANHLNVIHYWPLLEFKCSVCFQTQAVKGGARVLWCIPGLHIGQAFSSLIIRPCIGCRRRLYEHSEEQAVASQWSWPAENRLVLKSV